jgi:hypothetical protein
VGPWGVFHSTGVPLLSDICAPWDLDALRRFRASNETQ